MMELNGVEKAQVLCRETRTGTEPQSVRRSWTAAPACSRRPARHKTPTALLLADRRAEPCDDRNRGVRGTSHEKEGDRQGRVSLQQRDTEIEVGGRRCVCVFFSSRDPRCLPCFLGYRFERERETERKREGARAEERRSDEHRVTFEEAMEAPWKTFCLSSRGDKGTLPKHP